MTTVRQLIDSLGGVQAVARKMGCTGQAVYNWIWDGSVPETSAYKLAHVFGLDPQDVLAIGRDAA